MQPFRRLAAPAVPLPLANVDTDQIIPARFMSEPRSAGYGRFLLHDVRREAAAALDDPARSGAKILIARRNFGVGSSREAAVYALVDFGIGCVVAPSFGDIFAANAVNNGLVPARVTDEAAERLIALAADPAVVVTVDLEAQSIAAGDTAVPFEIDPVWRTKLLNGWDDLDLTDSFAPRIAEWVAADRIRRPWATIGIHSKNSR